MKNGHLSSKNLTVFLKRPYPEVSGQPHPSLFGLAPGGVCQAYQLPDIWWALTPPFHPYFKKKRYLSVALSFGLHQLDVIQRPCPMEPGLSSTL